VLSEGPDCVIEKNTERLLDALLSWKKILLIMWYTVS
jgi:hypothetical protein